MYFSARTIRGSLSPSDFGFAGSVSATGLTRLGWVALTTGASDSGFEAVAAVSPEESEAAFSEPATASFSAAAPASSVLGLESADAGALCFFPLSSIVAAPASLLD